MYLYMDVHKSGRHVAANIGSCNRLGLLVITALFCQNFIRLGRYRGRTQRNVVIKKETQRDVYSFFLESGFYVGSAIYKRVDLFLSQPTLCK